MAKYNSEELLQSLRTDVERLAAAGRFFKEVDKNKMIYTSSPEKWSVVQVLEHLNAYGRYYLPAMERAMTEKVTGRAPWFESGFWGDYFTKSMKPTNVYEVKNKMKAMKAYSFPNSLNVDTVVNEFIRQQDELLRLLELSKHVDLGAVKVPITITKLIKLKLGDTLRFLIAHQQRHMIQARNTLKGLGIATDRFPVIVETGHKKAVLATS
ncbi:DinB family protein [Flaviaesturariibacter amylovorans]|uniref:DinB-like domain-containing protein n=1 Tax=Flaviaesturariibacter amylovorans TaxID=1084520 RepID=A0ABP8G7R0_9BACT